MGSLYSDLHALFFPCKKLKMYIAKFVSHMIYKPPDKNNEISTLKECYLRFFYLVVNKLNITESPNINEKLLNGLVMCIPKTNHSGNQNIQIDLQVKDSSCRLQEMVGQT